jgi:protease PrsW
MGYLVLALAPVCVIAFYIYFRDKYEKEPWGILLITLLAGAFISLPVMLTETLFGLFSKYFYGLWKTFWDAFIVASLNEEGLKLAALSLLIWKSREFNEKFDGIVYASFISLGFAGIENVMYVFQQGMTTGLVRAITAVPAHALFGITMGYFWGIAKFYPAKRRKYLWLSFLIPFLLHGIYDFILMSGYALLLLLFIPFVIYLWISGLKKMKQMNKTSFFRNDLDLGIDFRKVHEYKPKKDN